MNNPSFGRIVGPLQLVGASAGSVSLQAQAVGTDYVLNLPNHLPSTVGQLLIITRIDNQIITLDWADDTNFTVHLDQLDQDGATNGQAVVWNGTAWAPGTIAGGVTSFNSRSGAVVPATNDYNFNQLAGSVTASQLASRQGAGTEVQMAAGGFTNGHVIVFDATGNTLDSGIPGNTVVTTGGGQSIAGTTTLSTLDVSTQVIITSDVQAVLPNVSAPFILTNSAQTISAEMVANSPFGAFIAFTGQGPGYSVSRGSEFGAQGWYVIGAAGISIDGNQGTAGQLLSTLGHNNTDNGPAGLAWVNAPANTPAVANEFLTSYNSTTGAFTLGQPSYAGILGVPGQSGNSGVLQTFGGGATHNGNLVMYDASANTVDSGLAAADVVTASFSGTFTGTPTFGNVTIGAAHFPTGVIVDNTTSSGSTGQLLSAGPSGNAVVWLSQSSLAISESQVANLTTDLAAKANLSGAVFTGNVTLGSTLTDGNSSVGTAGQVLSSTSTGIAWTNTIQSFGPTGDAIIAADNHTVGGTISLNGTTGTVVTLSGAAAYSSNHGYVVMVTAVSTGTVGTLFVGAQSATGFTVFSTNAGDTGIAWFVCIPKPNAD